MYAQLRGDAGLTTYKFLNQGDDSSGFIRIKMDVSCTDDPPQSDDGYLYATYWGRDGKKDIIRRKGTMEATLMNCPSSVAYFHVSHGYLITIDKEGNIYTRAQDGDWEGSIETSNHTNSRVANYKDAYYQSCSIDYWGSVHLYQGNKEWKKIDGNNHSRDLVAGPDGLLTRYPNGQTWYWHKKDDKWEALSETHGAVKQLTAAAVPGWRIYRLLDDGTIETPSGGKNWRSLTALGKANNYISVDDDYLYRVTSESRGYMQRHHS